MKPYSLKKIAPLLGVFLVFFLWTPNTAHATYISTSPSWSSNTIYPNDSFTISWGNDVYYWQAYNNGWPGWQSMGLTSSYPSYPSGLQESPAAFGWGVGWHALSVAGWNGSSWNVVQTPWVWVDNPPAPTATFTITDTTAGSGASHNLSVPVGHAYTWSWSSTNGTSWSSSYTSNNPSSCGSGPWVANSSSGSNSGVVTTSMVGCTWVATYNVSGAGGSASDSVTAMAINALPPVIKSFTAKDANNNVITSLPAGGGSITLTWLSVNTTSCTASGGWSGTKPTSGSAVVSLTSTATYDLTCQ